MYNGTFLTNLQNLSLPVCNMKYSYNKCSDNIHIRNVHVDTIKVYHSPTNAQVIVLKTILKFTLKQLRHVSVQSHHLQGAHYLCLLSKHG